MILAVKPLTQQAYTNKGNQYTESNYGKIAADATVAGGTAFLGGKYAIKGAKKLYNKAKIIKMDIPKIDKTNFEGIKTAAKNIKNKIPSMDAVKTFVKNIPAYLKSGIKKSGKFIKEGVEFLKENAKKINVENIKKAGKSVAEFAKKPSVKYGAGIVAGFAAVLAAGYAVDFIVNKINAHRADKKA